MSKLLDDRYRLISRCFLFQVRNSGALVLISSRIKDKVSRTRRTFLEFTLKDKSRRTLRTGRPALAR